MLSFIYKEKFLKILGFFLDYIHWLFFLLKIYNSNLLNYNYNVVIICNE